MEEKQIKEAEKECDFMLLTPQIRKQKAQILLAFFQNENKSGFRLQPNGKRPTQDPQFQQSSPDNEASLNSDKPTLPKKEVPNDHMIILLSGLIQGKKTLIIRNQNQALHPYSTTKLTNSSKSILKKISKTLISLLPIDNKISYNQFYNTYFGQKEIISKYLTNQMNLLPVFKKILILAEWEKKNKKYLEKGYAHDFLPEEILGIIKAIPTMYANITECFNKFSSDPKRQLKNMTPETRVKRWRWDDSHKNEINQKLIFQSQESSMNF